MKKSFFLFLFLVIVLSSLIYAQHSNIQACWDYDDSSFQDQANSFDLVNNGVQNDTLDCFSGRCVHFGGNDYLDNTDITTVNDVTEMTFCAWIKKNTTQNMDFMGEGIDSSNQWFIRNNDNDPIVWVEENNLISSCQDTDLTDFSSWSFVCGVYDNSQGNKTIMLYVNGTKATCDSSNSNAVDTSGDGNFKFGRQAWNSARFVIGSMDFSFIANESFYGNTLLNIYNNITDCDELINGLNGTPSTPPSCSLLWNVTVGNYSINPFPFNYSAIIVNDTNLYNCSFYINSSLDKTITGINLSLNNLYNFSTNNYQSHYGFNLTCISPLASCEITQGNIFIDTIEPDIFIYEFNANTTYYSDTDYQLNISLNDTNLAHYNLTIYENNSGVLSIVWSEQQEDLTPPNYNITNTTNSSDWCTVPPCRYILNITAYDDHNPVDFQHELAQEIKEEQYKLTFEFKKGFIEIYCDDVKDFNVIDENNKYKIDYELKNNQDLSFFIRSDHKIYFRPYNYKGHIYIPSLRKYFDLQSPDITIKEVKKISDYQYKIKIDSETLNLHTESIGDININSNTVLFALIQRPTLTEALLQELNNKTDIQNELLTEQNEEIRMIGIYLAMIFAFIFPFIVGKDLENQQHGYMASTLLFVILAVMVSSYSTTISNFNILMAIVYIMGFPTDNDKVKPSSY